MDTKIFINYFDQDLMDNEGEASVIRLFEDKLRSQGWTPIASKLIESNRPAFKYALRTEAKKK